MLAHAAKGIAIARGAGGRDMDVNPIALKPIEERGNGDLGRIDRGAAVGDKAGALDFRLAFVAPDRMPTALALTGCRIAHLDNDGPMAGRALADVTLHSGSSSMMSSDTNRKRFPPISTTAPKDSSSLLIISPFSDRLLSFAARVSRR